MSDDSLNWETESENEENIEDIKIYDKIIYKKPKIIDDTEMEHTFIDNLNETITQNIHLSNKQKNIGNEFYKNNQYEQSIIFQTQAIKFNNHSEFLYSNRALSLYKISEQNKCLDDCNKSIKINNQFIKPQYRKALTFMTINRQELALETSLEGLKIDKNQIFLLDISIRAKKLINKTNEIQIYQNKVDNLKSKLINKEGISFKRDKGHFQGILETRPQCRARQELINKLIEVGKIEKAYNNAIELIYLNRSDNMGIRYIVPSLLIQLKRDQEAYDFIKFWETCDPEGTYDWGNVKLPFLNLKNQKIYEDIYFDLKYLKQTSISFIYAIMLIKLNQLFKYNNDLNNYQIFVYGTQDENSLFQTLNKSLYKIIYEFLSPSKLFRAQIQNFYDLVNQENSKIWKMLVNPSEAMKHQTPQGQSPGSDTEIRIALQQYLEVWQNSQLPYKFIIEKVGKNIKQIYDAGIFL